MLQSRPTFTAQGVFGAAHDKEAGRICIQDKPASSKTYRMSAVAPGAKRSCCAQTGGKRLEGHLGRSVASSTSLKCVHAMTFGEGDMLAKRRSVAHSRPTPSAVSVPLPNSSMMHSDLPQSQRWSLINDLLMGVLECLCGTAEASDC